MLGAMKRHVVWLVAGVLWWSVPGAAQTTKDDQAARQHFVSGRAYFERAQYEQALREFEEAYRLSGRATLLINISRAQEAAGRPEQAVSALERWMEVAEPDDPLRGEIDSRLRRLRAAAEQLRAQQAEADAAGETESSDGGQAQAAVDAEATVKGGPSGTVWALMGGGAAVLAGGVVLVVLGRGDIGDVEDPDPGTTWPDVADKETRGPRLVGAGIAAASLGLVAAAAGLTWWLIGDEDTPVAAALEPTPGGLGLRGRF